MKSENSIERRARVRSNRLVAVWCVWHPDGGEVGLRPPTFYRRRDAVDARNRWNRDYPGHVVIKMTANAPRQDRRGATYPERGCSPLDPKGD
jgi:hypothetical protein